MKKQFFLLFSSYLLLAACGAKPVEKVDQLVVKTQANKTEYAYGENYDITGLEIELHKKDGTVEEVKDFKLTGDKNLKNSSVVTASYLDLEVDLDLTFNDTFAGKVTFVGDSLTAGHYWSNEAYPNYVKDNLPEGSKLTVSNCGKNGASFKTFGEYNPAYNTTTEYQNSLKGNPDPSVITILLGTNDATNWKNEKDDFVTDYKALVELYQTTFKDVQIIMITSPKCTTNSFGIPNDTIINEVNPLQRQLAEELELPLIDLSEQVYDMDNASLFRDGVHLTVDAAKIVAEDIANKVMEIYSAE